MQKDTKTHDQAHDVAIKTKHSERCRWCRKNFEQFSYGLDVIIFMWGGAFETKVVREHFVSAGTVNLFWSSLSIKNGLENCG